MRVALLTNEAAGPRCHAPANLHQALAEAGITVGSSHPCETDFSKAVVQAIKDAPDAIIAAGGDGTISAVAARMAGLPIPLGVLPTGTLNHFARDLGIPADVNRAARIIAAGQSRLVDVGQVNGHTFINNSSIGLYPQMVRVRDEQRQQLGRAKWLAMFLAALTILRRYPLLNVVLESDAGIFPRVTPFVFVGNNRYAIHLLALGAREAMDRGELCVYFANRTGRFGLFRLMLRALIGRLDQARDFDILATPQVRIDSHRRQLHVALDGEVKLLQPPLMYHLLPRALKVLAPHPPRY